MGSENGGSDKSGNCERKGGNNFSFVSLIV
jgi:hypothetical protein